MKKLGIVVVVYNIPIDVFLLQIACIKKFCKDEYTIEVVDNSSNLDLGSTIEYHTKIREIPYHRTYATSQNGSDSHAWAANFAYHRFCGKYEYMLFLDHDCFPIIPFSVPEILKDGQPIAGLGQGQKKKYMWPGLFMIANERIDNQLVDFSTNHEFGLDTGGNLYKLIEKYGENSCVFFNETYHQNPDFPDHRYNFYSMLNNGMFMHFINSSNWNCAPRNDERIASLVNIVKEYLDEEEENTNLLENRD